VAALEQSYELAYHALSDRYLVRNVNSGEQASYATLDAALDSLRVISNLPILDQAAGPARAAPRDQPARQPRRAHNAGHLALHPVLVGRLASAQRVVHMVPAAVKRTLVSILVLVGSGLWVAALLIMAQTVQQSAHFSDLHPFIVGVNVAGLLVLLILIGGRVVQLIRDWRKRVVGSRLEARMVWMSATLAMVPLLLVFYFSVMFLNRGIDSWFHVEIREGLENALNLSKAALDLRRQEYMQRTRTIADQLATRADPVAALDEARRQYGAIELTLLGTNQRIIGTSSERFGQIVPSHPSDEMVMQARQPYVTLDPVAGGGFLVRTAVPVPLTSPGDEPRMLEAVYPSSVVLGELADTVESAYQRYGEKARLREPLKTSFTLTLTLVLLLSLFAALYGAFWAARRLVRPIQDLVAGTRAVAKGDFDMRLPLTSHDEMGILVHSFQRHDQATGACARRNPAEPARSRGRARQPRGHPGASVDRRHFAGAGPHGAHSESGRLQHPRRGRRERHRQAAGGGGQGQLAVRAVRSRLQRASRRRPDRMARAARSAGGIRAPHPYVRMYDTVGRRPQPRRLRHRVR
jgi:HAMP domain-containing protein